MDIYAVMHLITRALTACFDWWAGILGSISYSAWVYMAFFSMFMAVKFLLAPLIGPSGSDTARKERRKE